MELKSLELGTREIHEALLARGVDVSESTIRRWLDSGILVGMRLGGRWRTSNAALASFLELGVSNESDNPVPDELGGRPL